MAAWGRTAGKHEDGRRRPWRALAASAALHLVFALSIFASASGVVSGGAPDAWVGDAIEVSLAGFEGGQQASAAPAASELDQIFERVQAAQSDLYSAEQPAERRGDLAELFRQIEQAHQAAGARDGSGGAGKGRTGAGQDRQGAAGDGDASKASRTGERTADLSSGDLWGQIEPCWRALPKASAVPVTLEIELNSAGNLARPPLLIRPAAAALNDPRLVSEARALAAVAACAPLRTPLGMGSKRTFRVSFMPSDKGAGSPGRR
jgi:hypothetical protein